MKHAHNAPVSSPSPRRPRCRSGEHFWQASLMVGQLVCLRCGLLACCPLCQPLLPTPELVLVHCARHQLHHQRGTHSSTVPPRQREVQP